MLPPTIIPAKPRVRRTRRGAAVPAPPGEPIRVFEVATEDPPSAGLAHWAFDSEITLVGTPIGLRVQVGGVWLDPISATQPGPFELWCTYDTTQTLDGKSYEIVTQPSGIVEANRIVLPENGTVVAP